jgi:hypothetical protein
MGRYKQGVFNPIHPEKYKGNTKNIIYRSSWELKFFSKIDLNPNVIEWSSEEIIIPYVCPLSEDKKQKIRRYFPDVYVKYRDIKGNIRKTLIEIKPHKQTLPPEIPKDNSRKSKNRFQKELAEFAINEAKWKAAEIYAEKKNLEFIKLTEKNAGLLF